MTQVVKRAPSWTLTALGKRACSSVILFILCSGCISADHQRMLGYEPGIQFWGAHQGTPVNFWGQIIPVSVEFSRNLRQIIQTWWQQQRIYRPPSALFVYQKTWWQIRVSKGQSHGPQLCKVEAARETAESACVTFECSDQLLDTLWSDFPGGCQLVETTSKWPTGRDRSCAGVQG